MHYSHWRWFYAIKTAICVVLNLSTDKDIRYDERIDIAILASGQQFSYDCSSDYWYEVIGVGKGLVCNWFFFEDRDSSC